MRKAIGRPKKFSGPVLCVRVSALAGIRLHAEAQAQGKTVSDVVRATLEPVFGAEREDGR